MQPKSIEAELKVSRKEYITEHCIRVFLTGKNVQLFVNTTAGANNKILIPPNGIDKIYFPEYDFEKREWKPQPDQIRPVIRTYTHRGINPDTNEIWIDFVAHGDEGPASSWAKNAKPGDVLGVMMHDGKTSLLKPADNYLLAGDATGVPVISAILENLPDDAKGICILEVFGKNDEQSLAAPENIKFIWLHNPHPQNGSSLAQTVMGLEMMQTDRSGFIAAEFTSVRLLRQFLRKEKGWKQEELKAYAYWKAGVSEDKSSEDLRIE